MSRLYFISLPYLASTVFTIDLVACLGGFRGEGFCYGVRDFGFGLGSIKNPGTIIYYKFNSYWLVGTTECAQKFVFYITYVLLLRDCFLPPLSSFIFHGF